jgi:selenocysteine-specific translation elongation factor
MTLTTVILNDPELGRLLGKRGTASDITLYNRKMGEEIFIFVEPNQEKLGAMLQAISMADAAIVRIDALTPEIGEMLLALDMLGKRQGLVILEGLVREQVLPVFKGTVAEGYAVVERDFNAIISKLRGFSHESKPPTHVEVDHAFTVKSVGTVVLGCVKGDRIEKHAKLTLLPQGKEVLVKSIQIQDENVAHAEAGDRVGLALKGVSSDEIERGSVLTPEPESFSVTREVELDFVMCPYFKGELKAGIKCMLSAGLSYRAAVIKDIYEAGDNKLRLVVETEKPVVLTPGDTVVIARPEVRGLRLAGSGSVI